MHFEHIPKVSGDLGGQLDWLSIEKFTYIPSKIWLGTVMLKSRLIACFQRDITQHIVKIILQ